MSGRRLVIVGAAGMVGGYALRYAIDHADIDAVTVIGRKAVGTSHPKLMEVADPSFADCSALAEPLRAHVGAVFCLGTYTGAVPDAALRAIAVDYAIEFARVLHASSAHAAFSFLSGSGADPTGQSRVAFARYKGRRRRRCSPWGSPASSFSGLRNLPGGAAEGTDVELRPAPRRLPGISTHLSTR